MNIIDKNSKRGIEINLYNLIEAVDDATLSNEKNLVPIVVKDLLDSGKVKLFCTSDDCSQLLN